MSDEPTPPPQDEPERPADDAPPAGAEEQGPPRCRECDAVLDPEQTYCLDCGAPTPLAPRLRRRGGMGAMAAGLAVLGVGAGFLGFAVAGQDDGPAQRPSTVLTAPPADTGPATIDTTGIGTGPLPPDTSATVTAPPVDPGTSTGFVTTTSGGTAPTPTGGVTETPFPGDTGTGDTGSLPPDTSDEVPAEPGEPTSDWPFGRSAWTVVVASAEDPDAARDERTRARDAGFSGAGILLSDDHPNLAPGLYVVYVGIYGQRSGAVSMAGRVRGEFPGAYPRFVSS